MKTVKALYEEVDNDGKDLFLKTVEVRLCTGEDPLILEICLPENPDMKVHKTIQIDALALLNFLSRGTTK